MLEPSPVRLTRRVEKSYHEQNHSDALVFFGATGDLAYKKVFPAIQNLIQHGHLDVPVIGVAKAGWTLEQFQARARDSLDKHGGVDEAAFAKLLKLLRYVDGDYNDLETFKQLRQALDGARTAPALPGDPTESVRHRRGKPGQVRLRRRRARRDRKAVRSR